MKLTLLIATTALALSAPAVPHAHAACATYNGTLPVAYWQQKEITDRADRAQWQMFPQNRPIVEAMADATYARVMAELPRFANRTQSAFMNTRPGFWKPSPAWAGKRGLVVRAIFTLAIVLAASAAHARDRTETCSSYTTMAGTTRETCREPGRKERTCTSSITGTTPHGRPVKPHIIQPISQLPVARRGMKRWWLSAIVYLACKGRGLGAHRYCQRPKPPSTPAATL